MLTARLKRKTKHICTPVFFIELIKVAKIGHRTQQKKNKVWSEKSGSGQRKRMISNNDYVSFRVFALKWDFCSNRAAVLNAKSAKREKKFILCRHGSVRKMPLTQQKTTTISSSHFEVFLPGSLDAELALLELIQWPGDGLVLLSAQLCDTRQTAGRGWLIPPGVFEGRKDN